MIIPDAWTLKIQRRNNAILMDEFVASYPGNATLDKLNRVQLYLGALTLAGTTNDSGTHIAAWALTGAKRAFPTIEWPNQEKRSDECWVTWQ
eukprot:5001105-Ditylum_brightwellii.AAC.1